MNRLSFHLIDRSRNGNAYANLDRRALLASLAAALGTFSLAGRSVNTQDQTPPASDVFTVSALPEATPRDGSPIAVVTTTPILADIVRQVGGVGVEVDSLLPANADAHDFEPAPEDIVNLKMLRSWSNTE